MAYTNEDLQPLADELRESGRPGGGRGRIDEVGGSGVQPVSIPHAPRPNAVIRGMAEWGQGTRGAAGYQDHGESELSVMPPDPVAPAVGATPEPQVKAEPKDVESDEHAQRPAGALPLGFIRDYRQAPR